MGLTDNGKAALTTDYRQQTTDYGQQSTDYGQQSTDNALRMALLTTLVNKLTRYG